MPPEDQLLLRAAARAVMDAAQGRLRKQLTRPQTPVRASQRRAPVGAATASTPRRRLVRRHAARDLELFNGIGGFRDDGREYVIEIGGATAPLPPAPWSNVVAHREFGFACTESGGGYTWSENSHDNRLTPWRNDPVSDQPGEAMFIRDEETGAFWSATPLPPAAGSRTSLVTARATRRSSTSARNSLRTAHLRVAGRPRQDLPARGPQSVVAQARLSVDAVRRMGARREPLPHRGAHRHRARRRRPARFGAQRVPAGVRERASPFSI